MKDLRWFVGVFAAVAVVGAVIGPASAQDCVPMLINYQGCLTDGSGSPVTDGTYAITFRIWDHASAGVCHWSEKHTAVDVRGGIFSVLLGSVAPSINPLQAGHFGGPDRWLAIEEDALGLLWPRQQITSVAYSIISENACRLGGTKAADFVTRADADALYWSLSGNTGITVGTHYLGTWGAGSQPVELHVDSERALYLVGNGVSPNLIGGYKGNTFTAGVVGATIGGGGKEDLPNVASDSFGTVGGGLGNEAAGYGTVGGGASNKALGSYAAVGGGEGNFAGGKYNTIGGGDGNRVLSGSWNTIGGGDRNKSGAPYSTSFATVAGGTLNEATSVEATVGGGGDNIASGAASTVSGGIRNIASGSASTIGGGQGNQATGSNSTIGGGERNHATGGDSTIAGGYKNSAIGNTATVAGGWGNQAIGEFATIAGGGLTKWFDADSANFVTGDFGSIGGGGDNEAAAYATVAGGVSNTASGDYSSVGGGRDSHASGAYSTVGGGSNGADGDFSTVGGGGANWARAPYSTIAGGDFGYANGDYASIGGGTSHVASGDYASIGGGTSHVASGGYSTVPGGMFNEARGDYSFAAGHRAKAYHEGAFVWADSQPFDAGSTAPDQVIFRCNGGVWFTDTDVSSGLRACWTPGALGWTVTSDRNLKENFVELDAREVLEKVSALPMAEWNFKGYSQRHIGPMAQDFHALFPLGGSGTMIDSGDLQGVALGAIQGLYEIVQEKDAELSSIKRQNAELQGRLSALEALVKGLAQEQQGGER